MPAYRTSGGGRLNLASGKRVLAIGASGVLAVLLLVAAVWMMNRSGGVPADAVQIAPAPEPTASAADTTGLAGTADNPAATPDAPDTLAVYITGAVAHPGVYRVPAGQRLDDLLARAGGPSDNADLERINLAAYLSDAAHYRIPAVDDAVQYGGAIAPPPALPASNPDTAVVGDNAGIATASAASGPCAAPVDINTADAACLETLPNIGPSRAAAIVTHRRDAGPFAAAADITAVSGIGAGTYQRIADLITVGGY